MSNYLKNDILKLKQFCNKICSQFDYYMGEWKENRFFTAFLYTESFRNMLLATALDPRYKFNFFEDASLKESVRSMLITEVEEKMIELYGRQENPEIDELQSRNDAMLSSRSKLLESFRAKVLENQSEFEVNSNIIQMDPSTKASMVSY